MRTALALCALLLLACTAPTPTPVFTPTPTPTATPIPTPTPVLLQEAIPRPPDLDLYDLAKRLMPVTPSPTTSPTPFPILGQRETFQALDLEREERISVTATLSRVSPYGLFYLEEGAQVEKEQMDRAVRAFEEILPRVASAVGFPWPPQAAFSPITILHARLPGVAGYFSSRDEYPTWVSPDSNQRKMIYINIEAVKPGEREYERTLAHELTHLFQWLYDPTDEAWVSEGLAELVATQAGYPSQAYIPFSRLPDTSLTLWEDTPGGENYGAAYLFFQYLLDRYGPEAVTAITQEPKDGWEGVEAFLASQGTSFKGAFSRWLVANLLARRLGLAPEEMGYRRLTFNISTIPLQKGETSGQVSPQAAQYWELPAEGDYILRFEASPGSHLIPAPAPGPGEIWWSNRGDFIDSRLTRPIKIPSLPRATLKFKLWFDLEKGWDYSYVLASRDGGKTWLFLEGKHSTREDRIGNSYGPGYTGKSGGGPTPAWVEEAIDLSTFSGEEILLRFEYVTDEAINRAGLALYGISIPEAGFGDSGEGWQAQGFVLTSNLIEPEYIVQLVEVGAEVKVRPIPLKEGRGEVQVKGLGRELSWAGLVVSAFSPWAGVPLPYKLRLEPAP